MEIELFTCNKFSKLCIQIFICCHPTQIEKSLIEILSFFNCARPFKILISNILDMVGNTPILKINSIDTGLCELYVKLENLNPGGSIKDRVGLQMITDAEK